MKTMYSVLTLTLLILSGSCTRNELDGENKINITEKSARLIEADNTFGLELFRKISQSSQQGSNVTVSPLSVSLALGMVYNGAESDTKTAMEKTLNLTGLTREEINQSYKSLVGQLKSADPDVLLEIADAIFYRKGFTVENNFVTLNQDYYNAQVQALDFAVPAAVKTINDWVSAKTHDKIPTIIDQINPEIVMILLNAVYFNGLWKNKFDKLGTHNLPFYPTPSNGTEVAMMSQETTLDYFSNSLLSAIRLPYGTGQYSMMVLLPAEGKTADDLIQQLNLSTWKTWIQGFQAKDHVVVTLPRFKFAFEADLNQVLSAMGMEVAFKPFQANFKGISKLQDLYIDKVKHKTYIDVNETGTEAAAVTSIAVGTTSFDPTPKIYFTVNKPFLFAITEKESGCILFIGKVGRPEYK